MPTGEAWWNQLVQEFIPESRRQNYTPQRPISLLSSQSYDEDSARRNSEHTNRPVANRQRVFSEGSRDQADSNNNNSNNIYYYSNNYNTNNNNNSAHILNMSRQYYRPNNYYQHLQANEAQTGDQRLERPRFNSNSYNRYGFSYRPTSSRRTTPAHRNDTTNNNTTRNRYRISRASTRRITSPEPRENATLQIELTDRPATSDDPRTPPIRDMVPNIEIETVNTIASSTSEGEAGNGIPSTISNNPEARLQSSQLDKCFLCEEIMQNSEQLGIHFCVGRDDVHIPISGPVSGTPMEPNPQDASLLESMDIDQESSGDGSRNISIVVTPSSSSSTGDGVSTRLCIGSKGSEKPANGTGKCNRLTLTSLHQVILSRLEELRRSSHEAQQEKQKLLLVKKNLDEKTADYQQKEELLKKVEEKLQQAQQDMTKKQQKDREEVSRKWQELKDETKRMEDVHESQQGRIRIDCGGRIFTTSIATLTCDQNSMLAAMFSGRHVVHKEEDGTVFIDRDGTHFRHILNYLRDGALSLDTIPRNRQILKELRNEAAFFQLNGLLQLIEAYL